MLKNTGYIIAIECLAAAQGIEFLRPLASSPCLEKVLQSIRAISPKMDEDRSLASDMEALLLSIEAGRLQAVIDATMPELQRLKLG
jgi:histidine ammonia-lyase